ncbi:unnamed protein product [Effrenium voratum]|uniref:Uncharacterized protein n=1 Tax=Effrenium voratum TaxID=2562239 RepID=A0AA36JLA9_9DINO|nr:unnamed protein product [Effrenium voratum]CAJ1423340.1 unnamed protein product [Effrenium voratum]
MACRSSHRIFLLITWLTCIQSSGVNSTCGPYGDACESIAMIQTKASATSPPLLLHFINREFSDGVIFCRGAAADLSGVFLDAGLTQKVLGSWVDCSTPGSAPADKWGHGVPVLTTLCLGLARGATIGLWMPKSSSWPAGTCWFQDKKSNQKQSLAMGPMYQSQVEFTITTVVSWDLTSVEGVSGGITMNYTDGEGTVVDVVALPGKFKGSRLSITDAPGVGFKTVLADKHRYGACTCTSFSPDDPNCNNDACYTGCPGSLADNPCGQHRCRSWYAESYTSTESYCGWLYAEHAETYCWAMDEWICTDTSCGFGGDDQPGKDCSAVLADPNFAANTYSCGKQLAQPAFPDGVWWTKGVGCDDKKVLGVPTNPIVPRIGGRIDISFDNLPWLHE